jgi:lipoate-protein ligase A
MLGVTVVLPPSHPLAAGGIMASFRWFGRAHADALGAMGVPGRCLAPGRTARPDPALRWACFAQMSPWEVAVRGRKVAGLCQARRRNAVILSSGILTRVPPWTKLCEIMLESSRQAGILNRRTAACEPLLGHPVDPLRLAADLRRRLRARLRSAEPAP